MLWLKRFRLRLVCLLYGYRIKWLDRMDFNSYTEYGAVKYYQQMYDGLFEQIYLPTYASCGIGTINGERSSTALLINVQKRMRQSKTL
jgi:hypothetical protein